MLPAPVAAPQPLLRVALAGLLVVLYVALVTSWYRDYVMDDAHIGFHYIQNLIGGRGFVFNPGVRIEGVSNTGWLLALVPFAAILTPVLAAKLVAAALVAATIGLLFMVIRRALPPLVAEWPGFAVLMPAALILAGTSPDYLLFSMLGMETPLLAALLVAMLVAAMASQPSALAVLGVLSFTVHPGAGLVAPMALLIAAVSGSLERRHVLRGALVFAAGIALVTLCRWLYFGALLPNTFDAKPFGGGARLFAHVVALLGGTLDNVPGPFGNPFALGVMAVGYAALRRPTPRMADVAAAAVLSGLMFCLYAAPDWTGRARYFAPYMPIAMLLLAAGALAVVRRLTGPDAGTRVAPFVLAGLVATIALPGMVRAFSPLSDHFRETHPGYVMRTHTLIEPALWMRDNLPPGSTIATRRIGALAYFSGHRVFDYTYGLTERGVAQLIRQHGHVFGDPNDPALRALWIERAPDYLIEDGHVIDQIATSAGGTRAAFSIHGMEYRVVRSFPIAPNVEWTLAERVSGPK